VCWLPQEKLKNKPDRIAVQDELLLDDDNVPDEEDNSENELEEHSRPLINEDKKADCPELSEEDSKVWDEFGLDDYDDEDDDLAIRIGSLLDQGNNEDGYDPEIDDDSDEDEDITLKKNDHILLAGTDSHDGTASIEVRIFNTNEEYYVRNDISLSGPPLCLCYVHTEIGQALDEEDDENAEYSSNFVAIGSITNEIQIWDLDVIDSPGPAYTLTGHKKGSSIIALAWDGDKGLASGATDGRLLLWSLNDGSKIALGNKENINGINQVIFQSQSRIISGDAAGKCRIYDKSSNVWRCVKEIDMGCEIEKICASDHLFAIGTSKGDISLVSLDSLEMTVRWSAYQTEQPITALEFKNRQFLFSSGHDAGTDLILWNISRHSSDNTKQLPLAQYRRKRHKQSGLTFCAALSPAQNSDLVLVGGESGGPQVLKLTQQSKRNAMDDSDTEDEEEELNEDAEQLENIKDDEWETDSGSSEGEEIVDE